MRIFEFTLNAMKLDVNEKKLQSVEQNYCKQKQVQIDKWPNFRPSCKVRDYPFLNNCKYIFPTLD